MKRIATCLALMLLASGPLWAEVLSAVPLVSTGVNLSTTQTSAAGAVDSTNTMDRGYTLEGPTLLRVITTVGATPTVKVDIQGSMDGAIFFNVPYSLIATPETWVVSQITITSATTNNYILKGAVPWRYLKLVYSLNTNVTLTADAFPTSF